MKQFHEVCIVVEQIVSIKALFKYLMKIHVTRLQQTWGISVIGLRLYLMAFLPIGLLETSGLFSLYSKMPY